MAAVYLHPGAVAKKNGLPIGSRVAIKKKKHPWHGEAGTVVAYEELGLLKKWAWRVSLDNGMSTYVQVADVVKL